MRAYTANMIPGGTTPTINVSQYDNDYAVTVTLIEGAEIYTPPVGATIRVEGTKPDGHGFEYPCTYQGNVVTMPIYTQMTVLSGRFPIELVVYQSGLRVGSCNIIFAVEKAPLGEDTDISETVIPDIIDAAQASAEAAQEAAAEVLSSQIVTSASGSVAAFSDGANDVTVKSLVAEITPVQSGSGDPSPSNIRPISGRTGMTVTRCGKNLLEVVRETRTTNGVTFTVNKDTAGNVLSVVANGTATANAYFDFNVSGSTPNDVPIVDGESYIFSGLPADGSTTTYRLRIGNSVGSTLQNITAKDGAQFTKTADMVLFGVIVANGYTANNLTLMPMIRKAGTGGGTFEPYTGHTYPISWQTEAGTVYGGTLNVTTGVLTVTHTGIRLTSTNQSWSSAGSVSAGTARYYCTLDPACDTSARAILCSHAVYESGNSGAWGTYFVYNGVFAMKNGDGGAGFSALADFKAWLDDNNLQICYPLATHQTYQLTPTEVKTLLGGNTIYTDAGSVSVEYVADTKLYIDNKIAELQALVLEN